MEDEKIRRMVELYQKEMDDIWNETSRMTTEEFDEYYKLIELFRQANPKCPMWEED